MKNIILASAFIFSAVGLWGQSQTINFGSDLGTGSYSDGTAWQSEGYTFQIGVFNAGFVPSVSNVNDWAANWNVANQGGRTGETTWLDDGGDLYFGGSGAITNLSAPFTAGARVYIWGFDSTLDGTNEWVLLTNVSWVVASDISTPQNSNYLTSASGVEAVIGNFDGTNFTSVKVVIGSEIPEPSTFAAVAGLAVLGAVATRRRRSA